MKSQYMEKRKIRPPVNTKLLKIFKRRPEYMISSRRWVVVQNSSKIGSPNFAGEIGEVWFFSHTHTVNQTVFHLVYILQIWKNLEHLWLKTPGFTPRCAIGVSLMTNHVQGSKFSQNWIFGGLSRKRPNNAKMINLKTTKLIMTKFYRVYPQGPSWVVHDFQ